MFQQFGFEDRVVIVTGASLTLARSCALGFARAGASVVINGSSPGNACSASIRDKSDAIVAEIIAVGGDAVASYATADKGEAVVQTALDNFDRVDVLVCLVEGHGDTPVSTHGENGEVSAYRELALRQCPAARSAWPLMQRQGFGRILFISTDSGPYRDRTLPGNEAEKRDRVLRICAGARDDVSRIAEPGPFGAPLEDFARFIVMQALVQPGP